MIVSALCAVLMAALAWYDFRHGLDKAGWFAVMAFVVDVLCFAMQVMG